MINWSNVTGLEQLPSVANDASGGSFWSGMLYLIWVILLMVLSAWGFEVALLVSAFVALVIAFPLAYAGLIAWFNVVLFVGLILSTIMYIIFSGARKP